MDIKVYFLLVILTQWKLAQLTTTSVSGTIYEDVSFIHRILWVPPSKRTIIEYNVIYPYGHPWESLTLGIYTTPDNVNIKKQCAEIFYGQVRNTAMHQDLGNQNCEDLQNGRHCRASITIQDFTRRNFSFSLGFSCYDVDHPKRASALSLKGLTFNISIRGQTNKTTCSSLNFNSMCLKYYQEAAFPNLIGEHKSDVMLNFVLNNFLLRNNFQCYKHAIELFCHVYAPKCKYKRNHIDQTYYTIIPPCSEMCHKYFRACGNHEIDMNCDYLPSLNDSIECFDRHVTCSNLPPVTNGTFVIKNIPERPYIAKYSCNEGFTLKGNRTITCMYNGHQCHLCV